MNYDPIDPDKMGLPAGITCGDCRHIGRCKAMFGHVEADTYCDWSPSRFADHRADDDIRALSNKKDPAGG
jgi:hypothetical protein